MANSRTVLTTKILFAKSCIYINIDSFRDFSVQVWDYPACEYSHYMHREKQLVNFTNTLVFEWTTTCAT